MTQAEQGAAAAQVADAYFKAWQDGDIDRKSVV